MVLKYAWNKEATLNKILIFLIYSIQLEICNDGRYGFLQMILQQRNTKNVCYRLYKCDTYNKRRYISRNFGTIHMLHDI